VVRVGKSVREHGCNRWQFIGQREGEREYSLCLKSNCYVHTFLDGLWFANGGTGKGETGDNRTIESFL
jgi:hypothetical protein